MKQTQLEELASGKILPLLLHYAWPALITTTLNLMYNVVDRIFVGNVCGADAIAGLSLTFPIMSVIAAVGVLIGAGSGAVISIFLGEKRMADAERALGQCVAMKGIFGIVMPPLMIFFFLDPILRMMVGGDGVAPETLDAARLYLNIVIPFSFFSHLAFGLSNCMRAEGSPKQSMYCMLVGFGINLILDPIFIYGFGWGIAGAAWATNNTPSITDDLTNTISGYATVSYSYQNLFTINVNGRVDGSNRFGDQSNDKLLPIWSASASFNFSELEFMKELEWLDYLTVKASYGFQGNMLSSESPVLTIIKQPQNT